MRYSIEPKDRKYVKGYSFSSFFQKKIGNKYGKDLMNTTTKEEADAAETASNRVFQKQQRPQKIRLQIK